MAPVPDWLELILWSKAAFEVIVLGADLGSAFTRYRNDPKVAAEAQRASATFTTYGPSEIDSLTRRIKQCMERFEREGDGKQRVRCLCSVLSDAADGNGGELPNVDPWPDLYRQLKCASNL